MSLLVFSSANKIAQGIIKRLYTSGAWEKIVIADVYPNYWSIEKSVNFQHTLKQTPSNTKLQDIQITEKSDLSAAIKTSSSVLYVTHDHYTLAPSKLNLIKTTAELCKKHNIGKLVALTPVEYDHYGESNPHIVVAKSEKDAFAAYPNLTHFKADLTFGQNSQVIDSIVKNLVNQESIYLAGNGSQKAKPIHADDVAAIVEKALGDNQWAGNSWGLQGNEVITIRDIISALESHCNIHARINFAWTEKILAPTSQNLLTEKIYTPSKINRAQLLNLYKPLEGVQPLNWDGLQNFSETYKPKVRVESYVGKDWEAIRAIKDWLY